MTFLSFGARPMATSNRKTKAGKKNGAPQSTVNGPAKRGNRPSRVPEADEPLPVPSLLRGILPTPREVAKIVEREVRERPMTDKTRQWATDLLKFQYYFGGWDVIYRDTDQGREVLAVGLEEIGELRRRLSPTEWESVHHAHPEIW